MKRRLPAPSRRTVTVLAWVAVVMAAVLIVAMLFAIARLSIDYDDLESRADHGLAERTELRQALTEQQIALEEANRKLTAVGEAPVETPTAEPAPPPVVGLRGPSCIEELGYQLCRGEPGRDGRDGRDGTDGRHGSEGTDGADGADGDTGPRGAPGESITGPPGPKGDAGPAGPAGQDGATGPAGPPGVDGQDALPFTFSFVVETNPAQATRYTVTCEGDGCTVTKEPA